MNAKDYMHMCIELNELEDLAYMLLATYYTVVEHKSYEEMMAIAEEEETAETLVNLYSTFTEEFPEEMFKKLIKKYNKKCK